jgi:ABC-type transporter Mla MlaB component
LAVGVPKICWMLRIQRSNDSALVTYTLSGRIGKENLAELQQLLETESKAENITLDLREVKLVDRQAVRFLAACEARGMNLKNCPSYIRQWVRGGRGIGDEA